MRVKLRYGGAARVVDAPDALSTAALVSLAAATFSLDAARVSLLAGYPPALLAAGGACSVRDGSVVDVRFTPPPPPLRRVVVPADNSCLFTSVALLLSLPPSGAGAPAALREACAAAVLADGDAYSEAVLGRPPREYAAHIRAPAAWGGGIELAVLAARHGVELAAIEIRSGAVYVFGEGKGALKRGWLVFDGTHYDPLTRGGDAPRLCAADDADTLAEAVALARAMRERHEFTDLEAFTLRCGVCAQGVVGEAGALAHAKATSHTNFTEYNAAPGPAR
jgi:ubiquitin thioesterase OTU1